ncbi:hypothetical protein ElyMa_005957300 [Elysia marginata]|uniref:DUF7869 domain-containing protein n=1 Tax=Elysia marginata TaxID=1093978 RepID=A0AAV4GBG1_9GAST|nr:hypothetical protein ElyMa_005957300 [Elysia marginata]
MTYYELKSKQAFNYVFDETNEDMSSHMFAYLHYKHFKNFLNDKPVTKKLMIFSDGCGYQNKCTNVSNASFLRLATEQDVTIEQKFLVSGHTQMEWDSVHSVVESKLKGCDIYVPSDLMVAIQLARQHPFPYKVKDVKWSEAVKLSEFVK